MNTINNLTGFFNTSFEFFSLIVFLTIGIFLIFHTQLYKIKRERGDDRRKLIAVSFLANAVVLILRQILDINKSEDALYDFSSIMLITQLVYPLVLYLYSVTGRRIFAAKEIFYTLIPLSIINISASVLIHTGSQIPFIVILLSGVSVLVYLIFRVTGFTCSYCIHIKKLMKDPFAVRCELLRFTLFITGVTIFIISLVNILFTASNSLMFPSLLTFTILSATAAYRMSQEDLVLAPLYDKGEDRVNQIVAENSERIEDYRYNQIKERLEQYFETGKPYLNKKLSIKDVATKLYTNKTYLSKIINDNMGVNFNQYVNTYRMKEVDRLLMEDSKISMKELCDKAGFGCMATFAVAFRLNKGDSPAEWCKKNAKNLNKDDESLQDEKI